MSDEPAWLTDTSWMGKHKSQRPREQVSMQRKAPAVMPEQAWEEIIPQLRECKSCDEYDGGVCSIIAARKQNRCVSAFRQCLRSEGCPKRERSTT